MHVIEKKDIASGGSVARAHKHYIKARPKRETSEKPHRNYTFLYLMPPELLIEKLTIKRGCKRETRSSVMWSNENSSSFGWEQTDEKTTNEGDAHFSAFLDRTQSKS